MNVEYLERIVQDKERQEILDRVRATIAAQAAMAESWMWDVKDLATWDAEKDDLTGNLPESTAARFRDAEHQLGMLKIGWEQALEKLHKQTVIAVGVARIRWRLLPERLLVVDGLSAGGTTAEDILAEALAWEVAWEVIEPEFVPAAGLTLAAFQAQHAAVRALERPLLLAGVQRRWRAAQFGLALHAINDAAQRWYAEAAMLFPDPQSTERVLLDGIPTTFVPRYYEAAKRRRAAKRQAAAAAATGSTAAPGAAP